MTAGAFGVRQIFLNARGLRAGWRLLNPQIIPPQNSRPNALGIAGMP